MLNYLGIGIMLGLAAGLAPGPLLGLVIAETLRFGSGAGLRVALAPLVTDLPIIAGALLVADRCAGNKGFLGAIAIAGGIFLVFSARDALVEHPGWADGDAGTARSLAKGAVANLLNPHPYLFWLGVGVPTMVRALAAGTSMLVAFIAGFYLALIGSKVLLAIVVGRSRSFLSGTIYRLVLRLVACALVVFALILFYEGLKLLGLPA